MRGGAFILNLNHQKILELLKEDPFMTQQAIADCIGLSRPSVANLISQLVERGDILGKAYILAEQKEDLIICIGAANIDHKLTTIAPMVLETSNPVNKTSSLGGVVRNVAENLGRLELNVALLTCVGADNAGEEIVSQLRDLVQTQKIQKIAGQNTGSYTAVLSNDGQLVCGLADMEICTLMSRDWIASYESYLKKASKLIVDTNVQPDCLEYLIEFSGQNDIDLYVLGVSTVKMQRIPSDAVNVYCGIFNLDESQAYFKSMQTAEVLARKWIQKGLKHAIVTQGTRPVIYANQEGIYKKAIYLSEGVIDVTGAGDSFIAGLIYGISKTDDFIQAIDYALVNSHHTVLSPHSVRHNLNPKQFEKEMEIYRNE